MTKGNGQDKSRQPAVPANSPLITAGILNPNKVRVFDPETGELEIFVSAVPLYTPRSVSSTPGTGATGDTGDTGVTGPTGIVIIEKDLVQLTDIESVTFEEYEDPVTKFIKIRAFIKVRNGSLTPTNVDGVDVRIFDDSKEDTRFKNPYVAVASSGAKFTTPTPSIPVVKFDRTGTAIAWGWNNVSGLGSHSSVYYEWIISKTNKTNAAALNYGTKQYTSTENLQVGNSGVYKKYRVSSAQGDTPATSSARWLRARAVVVGTDGKNYYSEYSKPI